MSHILRIPTKEQYAYIEVAFEGTPDEAFEEYRRLTDLAQGKKGNVVEVQTFTGETVFYDDVAHHYFDKEGKRLLSGSAYKKSLEKPFPPEMAQKIATKYNIPVADVNEMWKLNGQISTNFGNAIHKGMELYRKHRKHENEKNYFLPKNPIVREAVLAYPDLECEGHAEIMVSAVEQGMVGQIDWLKVTSEKVGDIEDIKTDVEISKNIEGHWNQLSFYAHILMFHGWEINTLRLWNWDGKTWTKYESPVLELKLK